FGYDRAIGYYRQVTGFGSDWQGYWVRILTPGGISIILPGPDAAINRSVVTRSRKTAAAKPARPDWSISLRARQEGIANTATASFGAAPGATRAFDARYDTELPPALTPILTLDFAADANSRSAGGRITGDYRDRLSANQGTWTVRVTSPTAGRVTVSWDGVG